LDEEMKNRADGPVNTFSGIPNPNSAVETRRSFLGTLLALGSAFMAVLLSAPLIRFALFPLLRRTTELKQSPVGPISDFASLSAPMERTIQIEQVDGWRRTISEKAVYVTKDTQGKLRVLSSICPHLGCTVPWSADKNAFACPCHGAMFAPDGKRIGGPALRGMDTLESTVEDGQLMVRFQYFRQLVAGREVIG
jgi:menaquinol-cytochrome c reductase iron-sulfur subunit